MPSAKSLNPNPMYKVTVTPRLHASSTASTMGEALNTGDWINTSFLASFSAIIRTATRDKYLATKLRFGGCEHRDDRVSPEAVDLLKPLEQVYEENVGRTEQSLFQNQRMFVLPTSQRSAFD